MQGIYRDIPPEARRRQEPIEWCEYHGYYISDAGSVMLETEDEKGLLWMAIPIGKESLSEGYRTVEAAQQAVEQAYFNTASQ